MYYCGIDIAKYKHEATVIDKTGKALLDSISFSNRAEGCEKLLEVYAKPKGEVYGLTPARCWKVKRRG